MSHRSADEVRKSHFDALGPKLGPVYTALTNEVSWLHAKWSEYRQLFATSDERIELLNDVAGYFFGMLQITLFDDILLHLAKLTDPPTTGGKTNLTLRYLPDLVTDAILKADLVLLVENAGNASTVARDWRNRRIAHCDRELALATSIDPLDGVSRADVELALAAFRATLNRVEKHFFDAQVMYEHGIGGLGNANAFVRCLQRGWKVAHDRRQRFMDGKPSPEDLQCADDM